MKKPKDLNLDTLSLHAGSKPDKEFGSRATPIYQTSSFVFPDSETAAGIFNNEMAGLVYSRITNPTNAVLEERISSCLLYTSPSPRDKRQSRMPSSA